MLLQLGGMLKKTIMSKLFHKFFDCYRIRVGSPPQIHIGRRELGKILFFPSEINVFMEDCDEVRVYDNGELYCDENIAKLLIYTDSHKEFMEYCFEIWKNRTNQKIYPKLIILSSGDLSIMDEMRPYKDFEPKNYLVE